MILSAKKLGYHIITTGNRLDESGHFYSDEYHQADFSDAKAMLACTGRAILYGASLLCAGLPNNEICIVFNLSLNIMKLLRNKVAVVTGGSRGLGKA
ncbi:MAG: hypothetical protein GY862_32380, partial [Gammaproteobacteria bacterium]|nr:hypothetical protein [Gammaproteobacteria bacterium]